MVITVAESVTAGDLETVRRVIDRLVCRKQRDDKSVGYAAVAYAEWLNGQDLDEQDVDGRRYVLTVTRGRYGNSLCLTQAFPTRQWQKPWMCCWIKYNRPELERFVWIGFAG